MAQVGRISGPLLTANLERNGIDLNFKNTVSDTSLLHLDISTGKLGVNKDTTTNEVDVDGMIHVPSAISTTQAEIADFTITSSNIDVLVGTINLQARDQIRLSGLATDNIEIGDNIISSYRTNSNIDLLPNGTGTTEILTNLEVFGSLHSTGNITADGSITIGDNNEDNAIFNADIATDILPDQPSTYNLGTDLKRWGELHTNLVNGQAVNANAVVSSTTSFGLRQGNIFYVSKNGDDNNVGDSVQGPFLTVKKALQTADASIQGPVSIYIFPGEYEEEFPLTVPVNVSVLGDSMRNVIIKPTAGTNTNNCFLMNGESTVQNLTVKDFFSPGYAFSYAPNTVVSTRSPYIQNVTVLTQGSVVSVNDPRGFDEGDAGRGALVDGASVNSASRDAAMLFHAVTFITPGVDGLTMTNGVKVEWLNSFTYFANRGLYAVDGITGHLSTDGSTVLYGAELRSIGSANIYGNYGAVADGPGTLMYLIQHNMAYIGLGKFVDNDPSRVIQTQEISKLNSGNIYFQTVDHNGNYRVGDEFFVDLETGNTSIVITEAQVNALNGINVTTNNQTSIIDGTKVETGNLRLNDNTIQSLAGSINVDSNSGGINFLDNTVVSGNVNMTGDFTISGTLLKFGNQETDTINFSMTFDQNVEPDISGLYSLGTQNKFWNKAWLSELQADDILFKDNFITTTESNSDLEFRANSTGKIYLPDNNIEITNDLTINSLSTFPVGAGITGTIVHTNNRLQTGNSNVIGNITATGNYVGATNASFKEIDINGNIITTTTANNDLSLRANGTGKIIFQEDLDIAKNIQVRDIIGTANIIIPTTITLESINASGDIDIFDNVITTTASNSDLELRAAGTGSVRIENIITTENVLSTDTANLQLSSDTNIIFTSTSAMLLSKGTTAEGINSTGDIRFNTDNNLFQGTASNTVYFGGVFSSNSLTSITADETADNIRFIVNGDNDPIDSTKLVGLVDSNSITMNRIDVDDVSLDSNVISTIASNSNLELRRNGTGRIVIGDTIFKDNVLLNDTNGEFTFINTSPDEQNQGWVKFAGTTALVFPNGNDTTRGTGNQIGDTRYNTQSDRKLMEVWDGEAWITAAGGGESVTEDFMEDLSNEWTLILG